MDHERADPDVWAAPGAKRFEPPARKRGAAACARRFRPGRSGCGGAFMRGFAAWRGGGARTPWAKPPPDAGQSQESRRESQEFRSLQSQELRLGMSQTLRRMGGKGAESHQFWPSDPRSGPKTGPSADAARTPTPRTRIRTVLPDKPSLSDTQSGRRARRFPRPGMALSAAAG